MIGSKLVEEMREKKISIIEDCDFFTRRKNFVIVKFKNEEKAKLEYRCDKCENYEIIELEMVKGKKKFKRPNFKCSKCGKLYRVPELRK